MNGNSIVVFDFILSGDFPPEIKNTLTATFIEELKKTGNFEIIEIKRRDEHVAKFGTQLSIISDEEKRKNFGHLLGVKKIFAGTLWQSDETIQISLHIINAETGKTDATIKMRCKSTPEELNKMIKVLARRAAGLPDDWSSEKESRPTPPEKIDESPEKEESYTDKLLRYEEERKSLLGAWALSFFIGFGTGNFYGGNPKAGLFFLATEFTGLALIAQPDFDSIALGALIFVVFRQVDWIYAIYGTGKYNEELMKKILISRNNYYPYVSLAGNAPVYGFGVRF